MIVRRRDLGAVQAPHRVRRATRREGGSQSQLEALRWEMS